jgi:pyruvate ferredoxin oxidoreductase alpha subunit
MMPVSLENQEAIDNFLPPLKHHYNLSDVSVVKGIDPVTTPHLRDRGSEGIAPGYFEYRYAMQKALENSIEVIMEVHDEFSEKFGRSYGNGIYKTYLSEDAEILIFAMGSVASQARNVISKLRKEGLKVGLVSLKLFRPFPSSQLRELFKDTKLVVVFDRDIGYGYEGVLSYELKAALYGLKQAPFIKGFIVGLGGRDVTDQHIATGVTKAIKESEKGIISHETDFIGTKLDYLGDYDEKEYFERG